ncbi:putative 7-deoxyloganetin glucosyltransferase [Rosa chinensis]|uniref:Putative 7-deoxyloganetin glucosyltransferase n=1 Tax=Rosa chinensis TaxID=74649 RepID=A0A2P6S0U0_ROSCH|nr:putative 7-deoxyloganetin glucosyltransferase [Rosa chinensis]
MLKFSRLLHHKGFHITFVNTEFNHKRFLKSLGPDALDGSPDFRFVTIPDGLQNSDEDTTQDHILLDESWLTNGFLDKVTDWVPGFKSIRLRDLPNNFMITNPNDTHWTFCLQAIERVGEASAFILHTFDALESHVLEAFSSTMLVYTIGPLQLLLNQLPEESLKPMGYSVWKEETDCLQGTKLSSLPFLWVIRPDLVVGESAILPPEFVTETKDRGLLASWCPQEEVLSHPSVGGFLTQWVEFDH